MSQKQLILFGFFKISYNFLYFLINNQIDFEKTHYLYTSHKIIYYFKKITMRVFEKHT
jgi:hypothetical protein